MHSGHKGPYSFVVTHTGSDVDDVVEGGGGGVSEGVVVVV